MGSNVEELYKRIQEDPAHTQALFRQALQDPQGALSSICEYGQAIGLSVSKDDVKRYVAQLDDLDTKQWLIKARGGL